MRSGRCAHPSTGAPADVAVLVVAKAPVRGLAKTRLAARLGDDVAADLAAAALLDTLDVVESWAPQSCRMLALTGDLEQAERCRALSETLTRWQVVEQRGDTFAHRLVTAHRDAASRFGSGTTVVQIGMDTPGITARDLAALAGPVSGSARHDRSYDAALGPAWDGGWWGLATSAVGYVERLVDVPMSRPDTCLQTRRALEAAGARVALVHQLRDVDEPADLAAVAGAAPGSRFAAAVDALREVAR
ncbi:MAG: TIGR04282 family arsenosugar biosynthesis glycosyltransferase [Nocardioidaceae bacterium]